MCLRLMWTPQGHISLPGERPGAAAGCLLGTQAARGRECCLAAAAVVIIMMIVI